MRIHRLIAILLLLESRGRMKARELADALEVNERSIHRDIEALCEAGIPIQSTAGPTGGFGLMEGYTSSLSGLNCDEMVSLYLNGVGIRLDQVTGSAVDLASALSKLELNMPDAYKEDIAKARSRFLFDPTPWWKDRLPFPSLETLRAALWNSEKVLIGYTGPKGGVSERIVRPYGLVVKAMIWYLVAFCETRNDTRAFRCDRVITAVPTGDRFAIPEGFDLESFWRGNTESFYVSRID